MNIKRNARLTAAYEGMIADSDVLRAIGRRNAVHVDDRRRIVAVFDYDPPIPYKLKADPCRDLHR